MADNPFNDPRLTDRQVLEMIIASATLHRLTMVPSTQSEKEAAEVTARLEPLLRKCLENMDKLDKVLAELCNTKEDLAVERASNRNLKAICAMGASIFYGPETWYPVEIRELVVKMQAVGKP